MPWSEKLTSEVSFDMQMSKFQLVNNNGLHIKYNNI